MTTVVTYLHDADGAADTAAQITAAGRTAMVVQLDISDETHFIRCADRGIGG